MQYYPNTVFIFEIIIQKKSTHLKNRKNQELNELRNGGIPPFFVDIMTLYMIPILRIKSIKQRTEVQL